MPDQNPYVLSMKDRSLNLDAMNQASAHFLGTHDFSSFSANRGSGDHEPPVKSLWRVEWKERGNELHFIVEGGGFSLQDGQEYGGCNDRCGTRKNISSRNCSNSQSCKRTERVVSAPAKGLSLEKVFYRTPKLANLNFLEH